MSYQPTEQDTPFDRMGGASMVREIVKTFYDVMEVHEPELARMHEMDGDKVSAGARERFGMFLIGWLGGPQDYTAIHGHPRLRMRHAKVTVNVAMRDAWLRCMFTAMDVHTVEPEVREFLQSRFADLADFLRNVPG